MSASRRDIYWSPWEQPGLEHLSLRLGSDGAHANGVILRLHEGRPLRCCYALDTDAAWQLRHLTFALTEPDGTVRGIEVECDGAGAWRIDGADAPALAGCVDVDISISPFTNTLPIRRLDLDQGAGAEVTVAYLPVPGLVMHADGQRYTCLESLGARGGRYRYQSDDFSAELAVDSDGLVRDYPELFHRVWPT